MRFAVALIAFALCHSSPLNAQARSDCPVAADLENGIRLTRQSPFFEMVLRRQGGIVSEDRVMVRDGRKRRVKTTYLQGIVPLVRREGTSVIEVKLGSPEPSFLKRGKVRNWSSPIEIRVGNKLHGNGSVDVRRGGRAIWSGNGCRYEVTRTFVTTHVEGNPDTHFEYYFAPALGVSLGGYRLSQDGKTRISSVLPERIGVK